MGNLPRGLTALIPASGAVDTWSASVSRPGYFWLETQTIQIGSKEGEGVSCHRGSKWGMAVMLSWVSGSWVASLTQTLGHIMG